MDDTQSIFLTWVLAASIAALGLLKIAGARGLVGAFARIEYPSHYVAATGALQIASAALLLTPHYRIEGAALGAMIFFLSIVGFLEHREYRWAALGIALLSALWLHVLFGPL